MNRVTTNGNAHAEQELTDHRMAETPTPRQRGRRRSLLYLSDSEATACRLTLCKPPTLRSPEEVLQLCTTLLLKLPFFVHFQLSAGIAICQNSLRLHVLEAGSTLFRLGDTLDVLHILISGRVSLTPEAEPTVTADDEVKSEIVESGGSLGEGVFLLEEQTLDTCTAIEPCELLVITMQEYRAWVLPELAQEALQMPTPRKDIYVRRLMSFTRDVKFFNKIGEGVHWELCKSMLSETHSAGHVLFRYGEQGSSFFIILGGMIEIRGAHDQLLATSVHHPI